MKSKGTVEAEISSAITQWEKDYLGRGSLSVKTDILRDMIIVTLRGILTPAEYAVCRTKDGILTIKKVRSEMVELGIGDLYSIIFNITNQEVKSFHTDLSTTTGERIMIFKLFNNYQKSF
ncbi:DUF2294 domain-containing protein [Bacillus marasmi]|uniref:DUF2294 domain-containing protein n=1 Tax=Bacillus marasmi TaxID=1926279 RepID=UPI0011C79EAD|nr:DUF2294 domain-containing protein [Bacillus marasmi]